MKTEHGKANGEATAERLADKIKAGLVRDGMTFRELKRKGWSQLKEEKDLVAALVALHEKGILWIEDRRAGNTKGRQSQIIRLHPHLVSEQEQLAVTR